MTLREQMYHFQKNGIVSNLSRIQRKHSKLNLPKHFWGEICFVAEKAI